MSVLQRLSGSLAQSLRLSSRHFAAYQQHAAFHLSASLDARRQQQDGSGSDSDDSDDEQENPKPQQHVESEGVSDDLLPRFDASYARNPDGSMPTAPISELVLDPSNPRFDVHMPISPALAAALEAAPEGPGALDKCVEELGAAADKLQRGQLKGDQPASDEDLLRVAEAIDLYFLAAPDAAPEGDGLEEEDRDVLQALGATIKEALQGGARTTTINTAPPGRMPWEVLDVDDDAPYVNWGVDLTEGKATDPWKNAHLSSATKDTMWELHSKEGWSAERIAEHFKIRTQRALAILALKEREQAARQAGRTLHTELQEAMDELQGAHEVMGSSERHHVVLPSFPNYRELTEEDAEKLAALLEKRLGKRFEDIELEDMTPEVTQELLAAAGMDKEALEEQLAAREEEHLLAEFRRSLELNMGKTGTTLHRQSRRTHPPKRPEAGWSLLVTPLGKAARAAGRQAYVAQPDGTQRELTPDEQLNLERQQPRPHHRVL
ncbi:hypothetical protein ABPG77_008725 [Micractinium sp. CCAP 211/92]